MNQPQDSSASPGQFPDPAAGERGASFGAAGQAQPEFGSQAQPGYGQTEPGYGAPGTQPYPSYPQPGYGTPPNQAYPSYPQPGYGQPYQSYGYQTAKDPALAEWWQRLLARVIDGLILGVIGAPLWIPAWSRFFHQLATIANRYPAGARLGTIPAAKSAIASAEGRLAGQLFAVGLVFYLIAFLYDWIQHWAWGQTIGKRALRTKVVRADGNPRLSGGSAAGRAAIYALTPLVPFVGGLFDLVNELWLTWDPRRQCLHDKAAHTVVIKKDYQLSQPQAGAW